MMRLQELFKNLGKGIAWPFVKLFELIMLILWIVVLIVVIIWEGIKIASKFIWKHRFKILVGIVILYFIFQFAIGPTLKTIISTSMNTGYNQCINELAESKSVLLPVTNGDQVIISPVQVCSEFFLTEFNAGRICGVKG